MQWLHNIVLDYTKNNKFDNSTWRWVTMHCDDREQILHDITVLQLQLFAYIFVVSCKIWLYPKTAASFYFFMLLSLF